MTPRTTEGEWLTYLKMLPSWNSPWTKTIVLSPHPDDETLGSGGLIADLCKKNIEVWVIAITDGENSYTDIKNLREIRKKEQINALETLGVPRDRIIRFALEDSTVQNNEQQLERLLLPFINHETHLVAPWIGDFHSDHEATGRVAIKIAQKTGALLSFYFFWTWHTATRSSLEQFALYLYPLDSETYQSKQKALQCYMSQQQHSSGKSILPPHLLLPALRPFEVYFPYDYKK